jgi:tRNA G18 (ribose-2'-O)-methylase SpoU
MPSINEKQWLAPFLLGLATSMAVSQLVTLSKRRVNKDADTPNTSNGPVSTTWDDDMNNTASNADKVMDSSTLDQRILRKAETALLGRTSRLIIVVERCTNDHNYSAILRSAEALGVQHVYIIAPQDITNTLKGTKGLQNGSDNSTAKGSSTSTDQGEGEGLDKKKELYRSTGHRIKKVTEEEVKDRAQHHLFAQRALEWLEVREFHTTKECIDVLRQDGYQMWSTDLSQVAVCMTKDGLERDMAEKGQEGNIIPDKLAIVFGTEAVGCSTEILNACDKRVYLPLRGYADSLNLSVATALCVHQLFTLDPTLIGSMAEEERAQLRQKWYTKLASQRLLTRGQKQTRKRIAGTIRAYEELVYRRENPNSSSHPLLPDQLAKIEQLPVLRKELEELEGELEKKALKAVEKLVTNPPAPLDDMRRADEHRATFAGKNTKKLNADAWADMPATTKYKTDSDHSTAAFFRDQLKN